MAPTFEFLVGHKWKIDAAALRFGASDIRVFGSVARGTATDGSDVDLLIKIERGRTLLDLVGFEQALEDELGMRFDVVTEGAIHPLVRSTVFAEARAL